MPPGLISVLCCSGRLETGFIDHPHTHSIAGCFISGWFKSFCLTQTASTHQFRLWLKTPLWLNELRLWRLKLSACRFWIGATWFQLHAQVNQDDGSWYEWPSLYEGSITCMEVILIGIFIHESSILQTMWINFQFQFSEVIHLPATGAVDLFSLKTQPHSDISLRFQGCAAPPVFICLYLLISEERWPADNWMKCPPARHLTRYCSWLAGWRLCTAAAAVGVCVWACVCHQGGTKWIGTIYNHRVRLCKQLCVIVTWEWKTLDEHRFIE